jgi:hypothetical protein
MTTAHPAARECTAMETRAHTAPSPDEFAPKSAGAIIFACIALGIVGVLNVIYGIAAIGDANFFAADRHFIVSDLNTWGWITLVLGVLQMTAAGSITRGGQFGRWFGILSALGSALAALLSMPAYPFWSLAVFAIDIVVIHGLAMNYRDFRSAVRA